MQNKRTVPQALNWNQHCPLQPPTDTRASGPSPKSAVRFDQSQKLAVPPENYLSDSSDNSKSS